LLKLLSLHYGGASGKQQALAALAIRWMAVYSGAWFVHIYYQAMAQVYYGTKNFIN
jgi:hypothetical protein